MEKNKVVGYRNRLMVQKTRVLVAGARVRRREGAIEKAILMCDEAASCAQEEALFEVQHLQNRGFLRNQFRFCYFELSATLMLRTSRGLRLTREQRQD